ncbi:uncharacterized protein LY89DRAFT_237325 [Mollisia scopiformis]|uniref:DUF7905 domain-containing protein n=1 Tax=Mollisia scopiformis TaxID=149040 RepID=A0A194WU34_MOLSC|nr:uncharacterized protein LY89DRAFT_237325 [Mollisia scopiformis]KUJ11122.1 hypothetical protein LY89DRAFT_237325 [Mollisia scopiformis]
MSAYYYERKDYAPKSNLASSVISKSTAPPRERRITFATEWFWYPEGVKTVRDRFNAIMAAKEINVSHEWDEPTRSFRLRCRAQDTTEVSKSFYGVLSAIIKEELKKGYNGHRPSTYLPGDDEDIAAAVLEALQDTEDEIPEDEREELRLDITESLNSRLIRRLALYQKDLRENANQSAEAIASRPSPVPEPEYPALIDPYSFRFKWSEYEGKPLKLEKVFSDDTLQELKKLTRCDFHKGIKTGILYIGGKTERDLELAKLKLDNLRKIYKSRRPYAGHVFYAESHDSTRFFLWPFVKVKKFYFETTLLDNLHLMMNGGYARQPTELPPDWQKLPDAITIRCALWDQSNHTFEPMKKVDISTVSVAGTSTPLTTWGFLWVYSPTGNVNPQLRYANLTTSEVPTRPSRAAGAPSGPPIANGITKSTSSNAIERAQIGDRMKSTVSPGPDRRVVSSNETTLRIEKWQDDVVGNSVRPIVAGGNGEWTLQDILQAGKRAELDAKPEWDDYKQIDVDRVLLNRKELPTQASSALKLGVATMKMKRSTTVTSESTSAGTGSRPPASQQATPAVQMPRSVSQPLPIQPQSARGPEVVQSPQSALSDITNNLLLDMTIPSSESGSLTNSEATLPARSQPHPILDDDVSMVAYSILQPARPGEVWNGPINSMSMSMQPMEPSEPEPHVEEELICLTPPESEAFMEFSPGPSPAVSPNRGVVTGEVPVIDKIQEEDEVATRTFHKTMNQKAGRGGRQKQATPLKKRAARLPLPSPPRPKAKAPIDLEDPVPQFVYDITKSFSELVDAVRLFRGRLVLQVEFGRILLRNMGSMVTKMPGEKLYRAQTLHNHFQTSEVGKVLFTNVLSMLPRDMQYLVEIKDKKGKCLWKPNPINWGVLYEFHYRDMKALDSPFFRVEINGETFKSQLLVKHDLGHTYVHGTLRHWDCRIAALGFATPPAPNQKHQDVHTAIKKSLYIPGQSKTPQLMWEMDSSLIEQFQLVEVIVKRVTKYGSEDGKSVLNVIEVQSLDVQCHEVPAKSSLLFDAAPGPENEPPVKRLRYWWEASISSPRGDKILEENQSLELGDEPSWSAKDMEESDVASSLYAPACEMLRQMDGVGFENRNGMPPRSVMEQSKFVPKGGPQDEIGFW